MVCSDNVLEKRSWVQYTSRNGQWGGEVAQHMLVFFSMVCDQEIDCSCQLCSIRFNHVDSSLAICMSPTADRFNKD